ncbi:sugar ABC transporter permease [Actinophytocola xinjiangensis]|uniref:Sugar ABC transporter permease n=1 Tax=Actinophytocola xinjiangensis TaxID=485602 RepID=A0A7Z1AZM8_9PSEU|nr:carbohydrate ABC transporter permease [Actinophytocola xinjiangensis]OLF13674.1 sugar ABC transporter permease [Actinophytocola xinjiangensis]
MTGERGTRRKDRVARLGLHLVLAAGLVVMVGPFVWMVLSSFKTESEIRQVPMTWLPDEVTFANYGDLFARLDFPTYFTNSVVVTVFTTLTNLLFCSAAGYALAKLPFGGRRLLFAVVLGTIMVPNIVTIVPLFVLSSNLGLVNTLAGLILPFAAQAFGVFLMRQFILSIPDDLLEAARIDGATEFRIFRRIVLPLCRPALATLGILTFLSSWNNFLWPLVSATTEDTYTLPVALALYAIGQNRTDYDLLLAGSVVVVVPVLVVFVLLQRHFVRGIATTGLK